MTGELTEQLAWKYGSWEGNAHIYCSVRKGQNSGREQISEVCTRQFICDKESFSFQNCDNSNSLISEYSITFRIHVGLSIQQANLSEGEASISAYLCIKKEQMVGCNFRTKSC